MLLYIKNLLPRLRQYSQSLDKIELLVEHPWVLIDEEMNQHKYIFRRNGDLLMSINGKGVKGKWEYLSVAKSLWIDRGQDNIMLNHDFIDPAVMILKMDGNKDMPFVLANENLVPELKVLMYLVAFLDSKGIDASELLPHDNIDLEQLLSSSTFSKRYLTNKGEIMIEQRHPTQITNKDKVYINDTPAPDGKYKFNWREFILVKDGQIYENWSNL